MAKRKASRVKFKGSLMFPGKYIKCEELQGQDHTVQINNLTKKTEKTDEGEDEFWVLHFTSEMKPMILKPLNAGTIAAMYGGEASKWVGKSITLYPTECFAFGDPRTPCIRIRDEAPQQQQQSNPPPQQQRSQPAQQQQQPPPEQKPDAEKSELLDKVRTLMVDRWPGRTGSDMQAKKRILVAVFRSQKFADVEAMPTADLSNAFEMFEGLLADDVELDTVLAGDNDMP